MPDYRHIIVEGRSRTDEYTSPKSGGGPPPLPPRRVGQHAAYLRRSLSSLETEIGELAEERAEAGLNDRFGIVIDVVSEAGYPLQVDSLENRRVGLELLNVRTKTTVVRGVRKTVTHATVFVPYGKLSHLVKLVEAYGTERTIKGNPKNQPLVASISDIKRAALEAFWTESTSLPGASQAVWWEAWLRAGSKEGERQTIETEFLALTQSLNIEVWEKRLVFAENTVRLVKATQSQLSESLDLLNCLTELRRPQEAADFFMGLNPQEQAAWVENLAARIRAPIASAPAVCLLDTGVNYQHPLLAVALVAADAHTYNPAWGKTDDPAKPHGTEMAGLAVFGELTPALAGIGPVPLQHRLESVKIFRASAPHEPRLYGSVTRDAVAAPEIAAPQRKRVFSMQVTSPATADKGRPTSWSTTVDELCSAMNEAPPERRLMFVSAGNIGLAVKREYPSKNDKSSIHDPAQAWNAVTVGAFTEKDTVNEPALQGRELVAARGALGPESATSRSWDDQWPIKPDFVMEGGNMVVEPSTGAVDYADSLQLLTTHAHFQTRLLTVTGDTSAAVVQAARYGALLIAEYPTLWPETVRALLVHSCEWMPAMLGGRDKWVIRKATEWPQILRRVGYGRPDFFRARRTLENSVTLVSEGELQPFTVEQSKDKTKEWAIHELPWPREVLSQLLAVPTEMRVTLSYFIEPNPGPRAATGKYRYASCGLRFDVRRPTESAEAFEARINKQMRDEADTSYGSESDSTEWLLGSQLRARGSLHSDIWHGTAAALAEKNTIAVYPVNGWWRLRKHLGKINERVRYALVVSISTPPNTVDIYTPIVNEIATTIPTPDQ